jgi:tetratricopeptide (TPR) repeat protein
MAIEEPSPPPTSSVPVGAIIVLILAVLSYLAMAAALGDIGHSDNAGNAIDAGLAVFFGFFVWVWLGVLLLIAGVKGNMPVWAGITVAILLPASAVTSSIAVDLHTIGGLSPRIEPFALPPIFAAYALYARLTVLHRVIPLVPVTIAAVVAMAALTLLPMPPFVAREHARAIIEAEEAKKALAEAQAADKRHAEVLAKFEALTPASPLSDWAQFFGKDGEFDERAIAAARQLPHRQEEAIDALRRGMTFPLTEYGRLDLQATPELCAAARDFLIAAAASHKPSTNPDDRSAQNYFEPLAGGMELLTKDSCDLDAAFKALDATFSDEPGFRAYLAWRQANGFFRREDYDRAITGYTTAIELSPEFEQYRADRGSAYLDKLDYAKAIPDFTEAIRLNPGYSTAYNARGYCYRELGDDEHALADFDKAVELRHEFPRALYNRGTIYAAGGDPARAIADYDAAIAISPKFWEAFAARGRARYLQGAYPEAIADLSTALTLGPKDDAYYTALWLYLVRLRAKQPARDALAKEAAKLDQTNWPWPIMSAFLGQASTDTVLAESKSDKDHECEANFYFGVTAETDNPEQARDLLQKAAAICPSRFMETPAAKAELARLSK